MAKKSKKSTEVDSTVDHDSRPREETRQSQNIPNGFRLKSISTEASVLDWDAIASDPDLELCVFRMPANLKLKYLDNVNLKLGKHKHGQVLGSFQGGKNSWEVVSVPDDQTTAGAEELAKVVPLLPRKSEGNKLQLAPRQVTKRFLVRQQLETGSKAPLPTRKERTRISADGLHGFFRPYGFDSDGPVRPKKRRTTEDEREDKPRKKRR